MNKATQKLTIFVLTFIALSAFLAFKPSKVEALASHYFQPVVFYPTDKVPTQQVLDSVDNALKSSKFWWASQTGQQIDFAPTKRFPAKYNAGYYAYLDYYGCAAWKFYCNVLGETILDEKNYYNFGTSNTGLGWSDRVPLFFAYGFPDGGGGMGLTSAIRLGDADISWTVINTATLDPIIAENGSCGPASKTFCGLVTHEIGHAFTLADVAVEDPVCNGLLNLMCSLKNYPSTAMINDSQRTLAINSKLTNPPAVGTYTSIFCFASPRVEEWCRGTHTFDVPETKFIHDPLASEETDTTSAALDCCRTNYSPNVTLGGFIVEWCLGGAPRGSPGCQKQTNLVKTYEKTLQLKPVNTNGSAIKYDVYVDYQTISSGIIRWKEKKGITSLCYSQTCPYKITWAKEKFSAQLLKSNTTTNVCSGYANCVGTDSVVYGDNAKADFTKLPPNTNVDIQAKIRPWENSTSYNEVTHWLGLNAKTPSCSPSSPTKPGAPSLGTVTLSGDPGSQSVTVTWNQPTSWGAECGLVEERRYYINIGAVNPPPYLQKTTTNNTTVTNLFPGVTYYWQVAARNKAGKIGPYSAMGTFVTAPADPPCSVIDVNKDGAISLSDTLAVLNNFGSASILYDLNRDGGVDNTDALIVQRHFGEICS